MILLLRKARGVCYSVTKTAVSFHCLLGDCQQKPHWVEVILLPPVAVVRVKFQICAASLVCKHRPFVAVSCVAKLCMLQLKYL